MKIFCIGDTHGYLPTIPKVDLFIHCGDFTRVRCDHSYINQFNFLNKDFYKWIKEIPAKYKILVPGNHDLILECVFRKEKLNQKKRVLELIEKYKDINCHIIIDNLIELDGLKIYGTPWTPYFMGWAFNAQWRFDTNEGGLDEIFSKIPDLTDILITHGPPYGILDWVPRTDESAGSKALLKRVKEIEPKIHCFGHLHSGVGSIKIDNTIFVNCAYVNEDYNPNGSQYMLDI